MAYIQITAQKGGSLQHVVDYLRQENKRVSERASKLELIPGQFAEAGSGDVEIVTITITYKEPTTEDLDDIRQIVEIAKLGGDNIKVERK